MQPLTEIGSVVDRKTLDQNAKFRLWIAALTG